MKNFYAIFVILAFLISCSSQSGQNLYSLKEVSQGPLLVTVNGIQIHQGLLDRFAKNNPRVKAQLSNPLHRKRVVQSLVDQILLYQAAISEGLDKSDNVVFQTLVNKTLIIAGALVDEKLKAAMKSAYEAKKAAQFTKLKVSLLAVYFNPEQKKGKKGAKPTDKEKAAALAKIKKIIAQLDKGADFAKLAKEDSDDKMTRKKGGKAGQVSKDDKRFARLGLQKLVTEAFKLKKDQVSKPIETKRGYYLVKVTSDPIVVPFEDAQRVLGFELKNKIRKDLIDELRKKAKIQFAAADTHKDLKKPQVIQPKIEVKKDKK